MAGKRDRNKAARRKAQMDRLAASSGAGAGDDRRSRDRAEAARVAAAGPSAARWLVPAAPGDATGSARPVDVVADLLALDPRTSLRGRGGEVLRDLAGRVADLIELEAVTASGRALAEVVVTDPSERERLRPSFDLEVLLSDEPVASDRHDRTIRVAEALLERAAAHREGAVDLHAEVAPVGSQRHARADGLETIVRVATDGLLLPAGPEPAIVTTTGGWIGVGPLELFLAAGRGMLAGSDRDVGGAALTTWLQSVRRDAAATWWGALQARTQVDAVALLEEASTRAGSDHPDVVGGAVVDLVALRYPVAPPI